MKPRHQLVTASFVSQAGNWLTFLGLLQHIQTHYGSAASTAGFLVQLVPAILAARAIAHRVPPHRAHQTWLGIQVALAVATAGLVLWSAELWFVYAYLAVTALLKSVAGTLLMSFVSEWVDESERAATFTALGTSGSVMLAVSPAAGGVLAASAGYEWLYAIDAVTFLLAAAAVLRAPAIVRAPAAARERESLWRAWAGRPAGYGSRLRHANRAWTWVWIAGAALNSVEMAVFDEVHGFTEKKFGFALAAWGIGGVIAFSLAQLNKVPQVPAPVVALAYTAGVTAWIFGGEAGAYAGFALAGFAFGVLNGLVRTHLDRAAQADGVDSISLWAWANQTSFVVSLVMYLVVAVAFQANLPVYAAASATLAVDLAMVVATRALTSRVHQPDGARG